MAEQNIASFLPLLVLVVSGIIKGLKETKAKSEAKIQDSFSKKEPQFDMVGKRAKRIQEPKQTLEHVSHFIPESVGRYSALLDSCPKNKVASLEVNTTRFVKSKSKRRLNKRVARNMFRSKIILDRKYFEI